MGHPGSYSGGTVDTSNKSLPEMAIKTISNYGPSKHHSVHHITVTQQTMNNFFIGPSRPHPSGRQLLPQRVLPQQQRFDPDLGAAHGSAHDHLRGGILSLPSGIGEELKTPVVFTVLN